MAAWSEGNVQANSINIHYYRSNGGNKPPILLLHGITDSGLCWPRVAHALEKRYDVVMTDARGHGHSGTSADFSIPSLAYDAAMVIQALELAKPYVWEHSMGAITAATLAANHPNLVRAAVLEDPPLMDQPPSQITINRGLLTTNEEQQASSGWQWLFDLRALPHEERIARGIALNPDWATEEITPGQTPKPK